MCEFTVQRHDVGFVRRPVSFNEYNITLGDGAAFGLVVSHLIGRKRHAGLFHDHIAGGEQASVFFVDDDAVGLETDVCFGGE